MLADQPFVIATELDPGAVHRQGQWLSGRAIRDLHHDPGLAATQRRDVRRRPVGPGHPEQSLDQPGHPRLPRLSACQSMSGSNQIDNEPRLRSEAFKDDQFFVW